MPVVTPYDKLGKGTPSSAHTEIPHAPPSSPPSRTEPNPKTEDKVALRPEDASPPQALQVTETPTTAPAFEAPSLNSTQNSQAPGSHRGRKHSKKVAASPPPQELDTEPVNKISTSSHQTTVSSTDNGTLQVAISSSENQYSSQPTDLGNLVPNPEFQGPSVHNCPVHPSTANCTAFMSPFAHAAAARRAAQPQDSGVYMVNGSAFFGRAQLEQSMARAVQSECTLLWSVNRSMTQSLLFATRGQMSNVFIQYFYHRIVADSHTLRLHERKNFTRLKKINMKFNKSEARATRSLRHFSYVTLFEQEDREEVHINTNCGQFFQNFEYYRNERCFAQCLFAPGPSSISDNLLGMMWCLFMHVHVS